MYITYMMGFCFEDETWEKINKIPENFYDFFINHQWIFI